MSQQTTSDLPHALLTAPETAARLGICALTLRYWAWDKVIPHYSIGATPRLNIVELLDYLHLSSIGRDTGVEFGAGGVLIGKNAIAKFLGVSLSTVKRNISSWPHSRQDATYVCHPHELLAHFHIAPLDDELTQKRLGRIRQRLAAKHQHSDKSQI